MGAGNSKGARRSSGDSSPSPPACTCFDRVDRGESPIVGTGGDDISTSSSGGSSMISGLGKRCDEPEVFFHSARER